VSRSATLDVKVFVAAFKDAKSSAAVWSGLPTCLESEAGHSLQQQTNFWRITSLIKTQMVDQLLTCASLQENPISTELPVQIFQTTRSQVFMYTDIPSTIFDSSVQFLS
jgi:hypothetical protein